MPVADDPRRLADGIALIAGQARAAALYSSVPLSFWGGVDPRTGEIIDRHHPLQGQSLKGRILAIPRGRGSCTGSSVLLELILNGAGPAGIVIAEADEIIALGVLVAALMFDRSIPVFCVGQEAFAALAEADVLAMDGTRLTVIGAHDEASWLLPNDSTRQRPMDLTDRDRAMLAGDHGRARQFAMQLMVGMARLFGASEFIDVSQAHIDGCIYTGPASLRFAEQLLAWGGRVAVPTSLNAISVDRRRWRELGVAPAFGEQADRLGQVYLELGARPTFTCAPYLLDSAPEFGDQIVWGESNAVAFANSVLGARTLKYPDYLDICAALVGRGPLVGPHTSAGRRGRIRIDVTLPQGADDSLFPLLGHHLGALCGATIPVICGLAESRPTTDDLKAFAAAFATTGAAPMFHIVGVTPEAPTLADALGGLEPERHLAVGPADLLEVWREFNGHGGGQAVEVISLGNPHLSLAECEAIAGLCEGRRRAEGTRLMLTMGRKVHEDALAAGWIEAIERFGGTIITDTCWCMIETPVIPESARTLMTNSGKYAHYGPGLTRRAVRFGSLAACLDAAVTGQFSPQPPDWLIA
ncbi:aconitase X [Novosphingobium bradum]|uniref:Aconitase X n=1 Tax=Novosphingobium bradum TaxID=1737444 RepID=A0ABV7IT53_9SPHN